MLHKATTFCCSSTLKTHSWDWYQFSHLTLGKKADKCISQNVNYSFKSLAYHLSQISGLRYYVSLCQHAIVHPLILNAWLPIGHYEISLQLQLSSMSLEDLNVSLLQQAVLTFVPQSSPMAPGSPTVRRPKSRDLKPANPPHWWHLSCDIPPGPIHSRSKAAEKEGAVRAWDQGLATSVAQ